MKWGSGSECSTSSCIFKWWLVLVLSLVTDVVCTVIRSLPVPTYTHITVLLCHLVTTVGECKLWPMASEIQHMHTASYNSLKYSCNNTHHHQWPCYSLFVQAVNVSTTDNSSMHRVWIANREKTFVSSAPSQGSQLRFSTCQRKKTVHRIAQQVLSHWVKWSPLPQQVTQTNLPACYRVTLPGQII